MRLSVWSRWIVVVALLLASVGAAPATAQAEFDLRGTWIVRFGGDTGASTVKLVINRQGDDGAITGRYLAGDTVWRLAGTVKGADVTFTIEVLNRPDPGRYRFQGTVHDEGGRLQIRGTDENLVVTDPLDRFTADQRLERSPLGGTRASATLVACDRDMTVNTDDAVLECTAQVTDASAEPGSTPPTGSVAWTAKKGTITPETCLLVPGGGSTSWCAVTLRARPGEIPIGTAPPVTAAYPGDARFGPSESSPTLYGAASGLTETDQYGPACNPTTSPKPTVGCGDPVNPGTGNLSLTATDLQIAGRGPALGVVRTYNAGAAADGQTGRFGVGWSDIYGARLELGKKGRVTVHLGSGATVPFTASGKGFSAPAWVTADLRRGPARTFVLTFTDRGALTFDRAGRLVAVSDRTQEPITLAYTPEGNLRSATDASGRSLAFSTDAQGRVVTVTDPAARTVSYGYDDAGELVAVTDVAGAVTRYAYDPDHRLTSTTDARGATSTTTYDAAGRVSEQVDPLGNRIAFSYAGAFPDLVTTITDGNGHRSDYEYRGGVLAAATRGLDGPDPSMTRYRYDERLALVAELDAADQLWSRTVDAAGRVLTSTDPLGRTTTRTWSDLGDPTSVVSPSGITTRIEYEAHGLPVRIVQAAGTLDEAVVTLTRGDPAHPADVTSVTDPLGSVTSWTYDANGQPVTSTDALGAVSTATYDILGQVLSVTSPLGAATTFMRDARGFVTALTDPMGRTTTSTYDVVGNLVSATDPAGATTTLETDLAGRPAALRLADGTSQGAGRDGIGDLVSQTDGLGGVTTLTTDAQGRRTTWTDALGNPWRLTYDPVGRPVSSVDPEGIETRYAYDAAGQLIGITYSDGTPPVAYAYDADGRRTSMTDGTGTTSYAWDARSRLAAVTDGAGDTVRSTWDARGGLLRLVYPDGLTVEHDLDALGRLVAVRDGLGHSNTFAYDADGRPVSATLGDGSTTVRDYDAAGSLVSITATALEASAPFASYAYTRDATGRLAGITEAPAGDAISVSYDVRGRLLALGTDTFGRDAAGSLTGLRGDSLRYDAAGRLVERVGQVTQAFDFDRAGRRIGSGTDGGASDSFTYDGAGRLTAWAGPAGDTSTYRYDGDGLRTEAVLATGETATFTWHFAGERPLLLDDGTSRFVYGPYGVPLEQIDRDGTAVWLHQDQAGSTRTLTGSDGAVLAAFAWDAYGMPSTRTGAISSRLGFGGSYTDLDTGFIFLPARVYDPPSAQFLTIDPMVGRTRQPYAFAAGDPLGFSDPSGMDPTIRWGTGPGRNVLAGHGTLSGSSGDFIVPEGTTMVFHSPAGSSIMDDYGTMIERGKATGYTEVYGPGSRIPDYQLGAPDGLGVLPTSTTVTGPTKLSGILTPNKGIVHWAACRYNLGLGLPDSSAPRVWGVNGPVYNDEQIMLDRRPSKSEGVPLLRDPAWFDWDSGSLLPGA
jgi:RHS repeat-associated protein